MKKIFLLLFFSLHLFAKQTPDLLFVLQDAGETNALLPVIEQCAVFRENFIVLTGGTASEIMGQKLGLKEKWITFDQLGVKEEIDKTWQRDQKISADSLDRIKDELSPKRVITGVAFELQGQLLELFKSKETFAYWDNINFEGSDPYFQTAKKVAKVCHTLLVPSRSFTQSYPHAHVVGKPSLELWKDQLKGIQTRIVAAKLPFAIKSPIIVFVGGYGREYDEALRLFLDYAKDLKGYTILLNPHPKLEGKVECEELKKSNLPHIHLLEKNWNISTMEAIALADRVICHQSSVGVEAAAAGKDVIYLIPSHQTYTNLLIEMGSGSKVSSFEELQESLQKKNPKKDPFETLRIPQDSVNLIYKSLHS